MLPLKSTVLEESSILVKTPTGTIKAKWKHGQLIPIEETPGAPKPSTGDPLKDELQKMLDEAEFDQGSLRAVKNHLEGNRVSKETAEAQAEREAKKAEERAKIKPISDQVFRQALSSVMTDNKYDRIVKNRRRGRLDMTRLPKAQTGSQSVFAQKQARKNKHYNIVLLVDESGSMEGKRVEVAAEVTSFLSVHMDTLANLAVVGFNAKINTHQEFDHKPTRGLAQMVHDETNGSYAGNNNNHEALETAYKMLQGRDGTNLVIYLSDGEPATGYREAGCRICGKDRSHHDDPSNITALVRRHADITTIGFGIQTESPEIPDNIRIDNLEELKPRLLQRLQVTIKRG